MLEGAHILYLCPFPSNTSWLGFYVSTKLNWSLLFQDHSVPCSFIISLVEYLYSESTEKFPPLHSVSQPACQLLTPDNNCQLRYLNIHLHLKQRYLPVDTNKTKQLPQASPFLLERKMDICKLPFPHTEFKNFFGRRYIDKLRTYWKLLRDLREFLPYPFASNDVLM